MMFLHVSAHVSPVSGWLATSQAVFYIMEQHTHILPSLCQLPPGMQQVVQTVLSGLAFNNGDWAATAGSRRGS